jgi:hypothetical protein
MKEGEEGQMHHRKIVAKGEKGDGNKGKWRREKKDKCITLSLIPLFPPNLEGKENCGSRLLSPRFHTTKQGSILSYLYILQNKIYYLYILQDQKWN